MTKPRPIQVPVGQFLMACTVPPPPWAPSLAAEFARAAREADEMLDAAIEFELQSFLRVSFWLFDLDALAGLVQANDLKPTAELATSARNRRVLEVVVLSQIRRDVHAHLWAPGQSHRLRTASSIVAAYRAFFNKADERAANLAVQRYLASVVSTMFAARMHKAHQPAMWRRALHQLKRFLSPTRD